MELAVAEVKSRSGVEAMTVKFRIPIEYPSKDVRGAVVCTTSLEGRCWLEMEGWGHQQAVGRTLLSGEWA